MSTGTKVRIPLQRWSVRYAVLTTLIVALAIGVSGSHSTNSSLGSPQAAAPAQGIEGADHRAGGGASIMIPWWIPVASEEVLAGDDRAIGIGSDVPPGESGSFGPPTDDGAAAPATSLPDWIRPADQTKEPRTVTVGSAVPEHDTTSGRQRAPRATPATRMEACRQQIGVFPIDASEAAPYLPEGFVAIPFQDSSPNGATGLPAPPGATATVQLIATTCTPLPRQGIRSEPTSVMQAWLYVDPPDRFEDDDLGPTPSPYVVVPWMVVSNPTLAQRFRSWGLPATVGDVDNAFEGAPGVAQRGSMRAETDGSVVSLESAVPALLRETTPERLRLFGVTDAELTGIADFVEDEHTHLLAGTAAATVKSGSPSFPAPNSPGVAIHVEPGYGMAWVPIRKH